MGTEKGRGGACSLPALVSLQAAGLQASAARIPAQQWRCEGRKVQEAKARQVREQVSSRNGAVPSARALLVLGAGLGPGPLPLSPSHRSHCHFGCLEPTPPPVPPLPYPSS